MNKCLWLRPPCGALHIILVLLSLLPTLHLANIINPSTRPSPEPPRSAREEGQHGRPDYDPALAATYMDELLADPNAARIRLCGANFTRRSRFAVVYMCFSRPVMIRRSLASVLSSDGIEDLDVFISQDGGSNYVIDKDIHIPATSRHVYIRHPVNLCTGVHHYFVKTFIFDMLGYDGVLIVEEDNVLHPQALQLLSRMIDMSVERPDIGIVSICDLDNSAFLDASTFAEGLHPVVGTSGHLWVYGFHKSRHEAVRQYLKEYYETIKGYDYSRAHADPLATRIRTLLGSKGFPTNSALSQDRFFIYSLARFGFTHRFQTLFRFYEPIGYLGLHYKTNEERFYSVFGHGMFNGRIRPQEAFDATADPANLERLRAGVVAGVNKAWREFHPRDAHESLLNNTYHALINGRMNGVIALADMRRAGLGYVARIKAKADAKSDAKSVGR